MSVFLKCFAANIANVPVFSRVTNCLGCSEEVVEISEQDGTIQSPGFQTNRYPRNSNCQWRISALDNQVDSYLIHALIFSIC